MKDKTYCGGCKAEEDMHRPIDQHFWARSRKRMILRLPNLSAIAPDTRPRISNGAILKNPTRATCQAESVSSSASHPMDKFSIHMNSHQSPLLISSLRKSGIFRVDSKLLKMTFRMASFNRACIWSTGK